MAHSKEEITPYAVKKMFEADFSERGPAAEALSKEERKFLTIVGEGIRHCEDGHYEMPLPLRVPNPNLPNNREAAVRRLNQLKKRFVADSKYKEDYTTFMETVIKKGLRRRFRQRNIGLMNKKSGTFHIMGCITPRSPIKSGLSSTAPQNFSRTHLTSICCKAQILPTTWWEFFADSDRKP